MLNTRRGAFTLLEVVFVIVILGILAAIAAPRFAATRDDAEITKGRSDIATIRSAIVSDRQAHLIKGDSAWIDGLSSSSTTLFDSNGSSDRKLLLYPITSDSTKSGHWSTTDTHAPYKNYKYKVGQTSVSFTYDSSTGKFSCSTTSGTDEEKELCKKLIN